MAYARSSKSNTIVWLAAGMLAGALAARHWARYSFDGKNVLITGGSRGLGLEIARVLVAKGANIALLARDEAELGRAVSDLRARAPGACRIIGEPCDLESGASIERMLEEVHSRLGPLDVVINNAGIIQIGPVETLRVDDFERALRVHVLAPLRLMLAVREPMRLRRGGRIANISSIGGVVPVPHLLPYIASKFALTGLSLGMRAELAKDEIIVTTITPGLMRTGSPRKATVKGEYQKEYAWFAISDSLPLLSVSSTAAARRVVRAIERGEAHVIIGAPAKVAALIQGFAPGLLSNLMRIVNRWLPKSHDAQARLGSECQSAWAPSLLTTLSERAAAANNEL